MQPSKGSGEPPSQSMQSPQCVGCCSRTQAKLAVLKPPVKITVLSWRKGKLELLDVIFWCRASSRELLQDTIFT